MLLSKRKIVLAICAFLGLLGVIGTLHAQNILAFPTWTNATRVGNTPGAVGFNTQTNLPEYLDNFAAWHSFAAGGALTITAGSTNTSGFTFGDIISSTGNLAVDSGIAAANVVQQGATVNFPSIGATTPGSGAFTTLSTTGTSVFGGSIRVRVRTAISTTDSLSATTDYFVCAFNGAAPATENLPATPATGLTFLIKDCGGSAATNNITITPAAGNIDGSGTFVMNTNFQAIAVTYSGGQWSIN